VEKVIALSHADKTKYLVLKNKGRKLTMEKIFSCSKMIVPETKREIKTITLIYNGFF